MSKALYRAGEFKDNCGFGLLAHMNGEASHDLLVTAIEALTCMTHRGGIAADGKTGDGCGLLMQMPDEFIRSVAKETFSRDLADQYAVGMVFLTPDTEKASQEKQMVTEALEAQGLRVVGWRVVPTDTDYCGPMALEVLPKFEQVIIETASDMSDQQLAVKLYTAKRKAEIALVDHDEFYICSLSSKVLSYKGLMMPVDLPKFYKDLASDTLKTAICVFHQRFSTNTAPRWPLAQPFRMLAHNGEINTIAGNRNWANARSNKLSSELLPNVDDLQPVVNTTGSDSSSLDNMLELLATGGMDMFRAVRMLIPPAWQNVETMDADLRAFHEYNSMHMEPWDGPAGVVLTDGRYAVCLLDRNGLRPARWVITKNGYITLSSEVGVYGYKAEDVVAKGRVGPGQILAVDTETGKVLDADDIDSALKTAHPYKHWLRENATRIESRLNLTNIDVPRLDENALKVHMKMHQVSVEEREQVIRVLAEDGQEAIGSMGDDTPMAVLSQKPRLVSDYFRQQFAQVTNPPIDPLREAVVMSLETCIGAEKNVFEESSDHAKRVILTSPVLSALKYDSLLKLEQDEFKPQRVRMCYNPSETTLEDAIKTLSQEAIDAVRQGSVLVVLSDRDIDPSHLPIPAPLATGAVHHALSEQGLRCDANLIVETGAARDAHQFAVLIGVGATAVYPYLAYDVIYDLIRTGEVQVHPLQATKNFRNGIKKGLLKILSKMGVSTIASYRGGKLFEAIGLSSGIIQTCFPGLTSRIEGARFSDFQAEQERLAQGAWKPRKPISPGGLLKYVHGGEYHTYNPDVTRMLQAAVQSGDKDQYKTYAKLVNQRPVATIRDLFAFRDDLNPIAIEEVENVESIFPRFDSAAMSLGALSPEAHEALAIAMNQLGGRSNSGEGGEDPIRYGTERRSKIKQIASGRFGVTPHYLVNAEVLQIKVAQGAKPGEGGQLPGGKVNKLIARLRYSVPGVTLISPPPHHDIYSIEDLAQLIFDLKQVNPEALVSVKLVSEPGVGTIAAGVAKAYADLITISGYDGGTAASPLTSIKYAGSPWELGLSETQQSLRINDLRGNVRVQTDGGLKTGLDVVKAAILGAESFGFGTAPMVALGCKYLRICHLNNCATGVATQRAVLRENHFIGTVDMVKNYFRFVAEEVREILASIGMHSIEEVIGRTDLLKVLPGVTDKHQSLDLDPIINLDHVPAAKPHTCQVAKNVPFDKGLLAEKMVATTLDAIEKKTGGDFNFEVTNCDRSIGARLSGEIAKRYGNDGMIDKPIRLMLTGTAGQSFGVWNAGGLDMYLTGDANDYVGKGMAGGKLVIVPPEGSEFKSQETSIVGNTCLYGATGGRLYATGRGGERFGVRNSGAQAVVEGVGDHCCEYMTGGVITVLGTTGYNFGAGMTGGFAYVLDLENCFFDRYNRELVDIHRIANETSEAHRRHLREIIIDYVAETKSAWGRELLIDFDDYVRRFWLVKPKAASIDQLLQDTRARPE